MFKPLGLLEAVACPSVRDSDGCARPSCPFSHPAQTSAPPLDSRVSEKRKRPVPQASDAHVSTPTTKETVAKRPRNAYDASARPATADSKAAGAQVKKEEEWTVVGKTQSSSTQPILKFSDHPRSSEITLAARQSALRTFHTALTTLYQPLLSSSSAAVRQVAVQLAKDDALAQELEVFRPSNKHSYKNACVTATVGIKKRDAAAIQSLVDAAEGVERDALAFPSGSSRPPDMVRSGIRAVIEGCSEVGTQSSVGTKRQAAVGRERGRLTASRLVDAGFVCPPKRLKEWSFMTSLADSGLKAEDGGTHPDRVGETTTCARCGTSYVVGKAIEGASVDASGQDPSACNYHFGRRRFESVAGQRSKQQVWTCCSRPVDTGGALGMTTCSVGPHVFKEEDLALLHKREAFITSEELVQEISTDGEASTPAASPLPIAALDCELSYTTAGMSLTRLTVINESGTVVLDELVRPRARIVDFNTRFSGIKPEEFEGGAKLDLASVRRALARFVGPKTILVGHGLENDLRALRLIHTAICDTTMLFPHPRGMPMRRALRELTSEHLGKIIQATSSTEGHSSAEDALMSLELVRWKVLNEPHNPPFPTSKKQQRGPQTAPVSAGAFVAGTSSTANSAPSTSAAPSTGAARPTAPPPTAARPAPSLFIPSKAKKKVRDRIPAPSSSPSTALTDGPDLTPQALTRKTASTSASPARTNPFSTPQSRR